MIVIMIIIRAGGTDLRLMISARLAVDGTDFRLLIEDPDHVGDQDQDPEDHITDQDHAGDQAQDQDQDHAQGQDPDPDRDHDQDQGPDPDRQGTKNGQSAKQFLRRSVFHN